MAKWFAYSPDSGMSFHDTPEAANKWAQAEIDDCRDAMDDLGWDESLVDSICWGQVSEQATEHVNPDSYGSNYELEVV
ncbi:hypothetical protein [Aeromonas phage Asp37]|nr:hypothetical protein [Aeromonas phage Asp37]